MKGYLYTNGCSWTAGGGLEKYTTAYSKYKNKGISWDNQRDINWPKLLSKNFNINLIDESESGGGMERVIRMTYEYILEDINRAKDTLFIIEIPSAENRIDLYSTKYDSYLICNCGWYNVNGEVKLNKQQFRSAVISYDAELFDNKISHIIQSDVEHYLENFINPFVYADKIRNNFIGLYYFMKSLELDFYFMLDGFSEDDCELFNKLDFEFKEHLLNINYLNKTFDDFMKFTTYNKLSICNVLQNEVDNHPSYEAHKIWAELLIKKFE